MADPPQLVILTAVLAEARAVAVALGMPIPTAAKPVSIVYRSRPVALHVIGIGGRHMPTGLSDAGAILLAGFGGGLDPKLRVGDVVVEGFAGEMPTVSAAISGRIACSDVLVATQAQKAELFRTTGALAVDMESDGVRRAAGNVPIVHLRAISDGADDVIDPAIIRFVDSLGRPRPAALAMGLLKRPGLARDLARLAQNVRVATKALAAAVPMVIEAM